MLKRDMLNGQKRFLIFRAMLGRVRAKVGVSVRVRVRVIELGLEL